MNKNTFKKIPINTILILLSLGVMIMYNKYLGLAILFFTLAVNLYTKFYFFHAIKGNKAFSAKNYDDAVFYYRKAANSRFVNATIINGYVIVELKYGDINVVSTYLDKVLKKRKFSEYDLISLNVSKALVLYKNNKIEEAIELIQNNYAASTNAYINETLSSLLIINGQVSEALALLDNILEDDSSSDILRCNYAEANYKLGNHKVSEEYFDALIDECVLFMEPYYYKALIEKENGNLSNSKELFEKCLECSESILTSVSTALVQEELDSLDVITN